MLTIHNQVARGGKRPGSMRRKDQTLALPFHCRAPVSANMAFSSKAGEGQKVLNAFLKILAMLSSVYTQPEMNPHPLHWKHGVLLLDFQGSPRNA